MTSQERGETALGDLVPMIEAYIRVLRNNPVSHPRRTYTRTGNGHQVQVAFSVKQIRLSNGMHAPGPIEINVEVDHELVFYAEVGGSAALLMMDGLKLDTSARIEVLNRGYWLEVLEENLPYLTREAQISC